MRWFLAHSESCATTPGIEFQDVFLSLKQTLLLLAAPLTPPFQPQAAASLLSVSVDVRISYYISHKWPFVSGLVHLNFSQVHSRCSVCQHFTDFCCQIAFHCKGVLHFVYPFTCWHTFAAFLLAALANYAVAAFNADLQGGGCGRQSLYRGCPLWDWLPESCSGRRCWRKVLPKEKVRGRPPGAGLFGERGLWRAGCPRRKGKDRWAGWTYLQKW